MNDVLTSIPCALLYGPELDVRFEAANEAIASRRLPLTLERSTISALQPHVKVVLDPSVPLVVIEVDETSPQRESETEATLVAEIARSLRDRLASCTSGAAPEDKGLFIVSPHHVQIAAIRRKLSNDFAVLPLVDTVECPSSDDLRPGVDFRNGGSGSFGLKVRPPARDAASGGGRGFVA
jgi:DNA replication ATP-dependent helicase Dna2